jgi:hypothetical protein
MTTVMSAQAQKPTAGYAPVNGLNMYYEIHGSGTPVVPPRRQCASVRAERGQTWTGLLHLVGRDGSGVRDIRGRLSAGERSRNED